MEGFGFHIALTYLAAIAAFSVYVWNLHQIALGCAPRTGAWYPASPPCSGEGFEWLEVDR